MAANPDAVTVFAPAKINLFLHVGNRRDDGYHALQSLVVFTTVGDEVQARRSDELSCSLSGPFSSSLSGEQDNLMLRAARVLAVKTGMTSGAQLSLTKNLPVASGIGGGSADAAATLRALWSIWGLARAGDEVIRTPMSPSAFRKRREMFDAALEVGSDVPVCLLSSTAWMEGRGEIVYPLSDLPPVAMVLINPGIAVPTGSVFARLKHRTGAAEMIPHYAHSAVELVEYLKGARNDLEVPACEIAPPISAVLDALQHSGAMLARMCGSGATCYGIFSNRSEADGAAQRLSAAQPSWWVSATEIAPFSIGMPRPVVI